MTKLSKKHRERLEMAATEIAKVRPTKAAKFDMDSWKLATPCGTAACAIGHISAQPWFNRRGLRLDYSEGKHLLPIYSGHRNWDAVCEFFGIDNDAAYTLFSGASYPASVAPLTVAKRIRSFLKEQAS